MRERNKDRHVRILPLPFTPSPWQGDLKFILFLCVLCDSVVNKRFILPQSHRGRRVKRLGRNFLFGFTL
jgi:hypothetical protein